ncbi:MAG: redoxin domain-containing protein [Chloroflexi bacterium]|nr:redoxin domain-containing protein [Chloroflexota bacterium]
MAEQRQEFTRAGVEVIAVLNDSAEHARTYFQQHAIPFPCLIDPEHTVYDRYQVESKVLSLGQRPGLFVIDRGGTVRYSHIGWQQWDIPKNVEVLGLCRSIHCKTS